jgi:serine/threonine protein kinase
VEIPQPRTPIRLGRYELLQKLATGGMAEIYVARQEGPHGFSKRIALKRILPQLAADSEFVAMFIDEARLCAALSHPNLVQVFDFGEESGELFMAMELVEGTTGAKVARAAAKRGAPVPTEVALHIALSIGRGLAHAHEACGEDGRSLGLVHRDVSPGNILISNTGAVKLADFGIARAAEFERRTEQGQLKGKLGYMSPEQVTGRDLDAKSDQFTAAIVLAELLTARPLFSGPRELDVLVKIRDADVSVLDRQGRHIATDLMAVLRRALSRRREDRFPTTSEYVDALDEVDRAGRLGSGPAPLVEWLLEVDLIKAPARSGKQMIAEKSLPEKRHPSQKAAEASQNPPKSSGTQEVARAAGKSTAFTVSDPFPRSSVVSPIYRVDRTASQPVSLGALVDLLDSGRVGPDARVSRDNGPYRAAREHPELSRACGRTSTDWDEGIMRDPTVVVTIGPGELPRRLFDLAIARTTGLLMVQHRGIEKKVFLVDGVPEVTVSTDDKELLGSMLLARGLVRPEDIEAALAMAPRFGGRIGDALVRLGVLRPMELVRAVVDQMKRRFVELVGWQRGQVSFVRDLRCLEEETVPDAFNPFELIARGIFAGYAYRDFADFLAPLEQAVLVPLPRPPVSVSLLKLDAPESAVLESVKKQQTLAQVVSSLGQNGFSREVVLRAVFVGLSSGILVSPVWPPVLYRDCMPTIQDT